MQLLELVPREWHTLMDSAQRIMDRYPQIEGFNIPDVRRLSIRSLDVVNPFFEKGWHIIPHIRSRDASVDIHLERLTPLIENGLRDVLVIRGDAIKTEAKSFGCSSVELIFALRKRFSDLKIYAAIDTYRWEWEQELSYVQEKINAGVTGFFTQPLFDPDLVSRLLHELSDTSIFFGVCPVTSQKSKQYWETVNHVVFPPDFVFDLPGSVRVVRKIVELAESANQHIYHMPIVVDPMVYLPALFS